MQSQRRPIRREEAPEPQPKAALFCSSNRKIRLRDTATISSSASSSSTAGGFFSRGAIGGFVSRGAIGGFVSFVALDAAALLDDPLDRPVARASLIGVACRLGAEHCLHVDEEGASLEITAPEPAWLGASLEGSAGRGGDMVGWVETTAQERPAAEQREAPGR